MIFPPIFFQSVSDLRKSIMETADLSYKANILIGKVQIVKENSESNTCIDTGLLIYKNHSFNVHWFFYFY